MKRLNILFILLYTLPYVLMAQRPATKKVQLAVRYNKASKTDTLTLEVAGRTSALYKAQLSYHATMGADSVFRFTVPVQDKAGYLKLKKVWNHDNNLLLYNNFWEAGDSIGVIIHDIPQHEGPAKRTHLFTGRGAAKYTFDYKLSNELNKLSKQYPPNIKRKLFRNPLTDTIYKNEKVEAEMLNFMAKHKDSISALAYDVFKANFSMGPYKHAMLSGLSGLVPKTDLEVETATQMQKLFMPMMKLTDNEEALAYADNYIEFYNRYFSTYNKFFNQLTHKGLFGAERVGKGLLDDIIARSSGQVRQELIITFLHEIGMSEANKEIFHKAAPYLSNEPFLSEYKELVSQQKLDLSTYTFQDTNKKKVQIADFKGKVIFIDTWFTGCSSCVYFHKNVTTKLEERFKDDTRIVIISLSSDYDYDQWAKSVNGGLYCDPKGINLNTNMQVRNTRHPMYIRLNILTGSVPILIDKKGKLVSSGTAELYNPEILIKKIEQML